MFRDRQDAGEQLGLALRKYKDSDAIVVAIPRGGVIVGYYVAEALNKPLMVLVSRKLPSPDNPEAGIGAIAENGQLYLTDMAPNYYSDALIAETIKKQRQVIKERVAALRGNEPFPNLDKQTVILVDDGIAMGSTMKAAIMMCRDLNAKQIVVAVPIAGREVFRVFSSLADDVIVLETPDFFQAVAQGYREWYDVTDDEARSYLKQWKSEVKL